MINRIIYVHETFYRKHRDMGIELLRSKGYQVELWSLYKIKYRDKLDIPKDISDDKVVYLKDRWEIVNRLRSQDLENTMFFFTTTTHRGGIEDFVRIVVSLCGGRYCNFLYEFAPTGSIKESRSKKAKNRMEEAIRKYRYKVAQIAIKRWCRPTFCFVSNKRSVWRLLTEWERKCAVSVHNKDYDEYLISKREGKTVSEKYIVFLDSATEGSEDAKKSGLRPIYPNSQIYYERLCRVFAKVEKMYGLPVVVAAHPKCEYHGDEFGGRQIVYYETERLVREARLVITHISVAVDYIILYHKPYLFLVDNYFRKSWIWDYLFIPMMKELNIKAFDFACGDLEKVGDYINYYNSNYDRYFKMYIKESRDDGKLFYEIVDEYLHKL